MLSEDEIRAILNEKYAEVIATKNKGNYEGCYGRA